MASPQEDWTEEEKAFLKGTGVGFIIGAVSGVLSSTVLFLIIGLYY